MIYKSIQRLGKHSRPRSCRNFNKEIVHWCLIP